jgi:two-component system, chemotaxis family, chemotaxis protein CheY
VLNGQDGIDKLEKNPDVNMMLVDINMPLMNGLEFIWRIKTLEKFASIPIVIVNTEGKEKDTQRGLVMGASGYAKKPFQPGDLHSLINQLFGTLPA